MWKRLISSKHNAPYWFNENTGESRWTDPGDLEAQVQAPKGSNTSGDDSHCAHGDSGFRKRPRHGDLSVAETAGSGCRTGATPTAATAATAVTDSATQPQPMRTVEITENCPEHLLWKRKYLFKGFEEGAVERIQMDEVSAFSITEAASAHAMTNLIWQALMNARRGMSTIPRDACILDGMSCVGGNTISFAGAFSRVISNELDPVRYRMLQNNTLKVMNLKNVECFNRSVLDIAFERDDYDVIFLDPEWGGPDYKDKDKLVLPISDQSMEEFCLNVLRQMSRVTVIALKLPLNYDNEFIESFAETHALTYSFTTRGLKKMSLTLMTRKKEWDAKQPPLT